MKIVFRADASLRIGAGHVMRCLTLARALRDSGHDCTFVCRDLDGHLGAAVRDAGFDLTLLPAPDGTFQPSATDPAHAAWAGVEWATDAAQTAQVTQDADWLVVDHYAFDARWQDAARGPATKVFAIDDLADRPHHADLLLDQNLGSTAAGYDGLVPDTCTRLIGPAYVLMLPEFAELRDESLARRQSAGLGHILVSMGGMDNDNSTSDVLRALAQSELPEACKITVVMGRHAPWLGAVRDLAQTMPRPTQIAVDVRQMAPLMVSADLAIGAAGGTSWERACLGLPSLHLILADNQAPAARAMHDAKISVLLGDIRTHGWQTRLRDIVSEATSRGIHAALGTTTFDLLDGLGCARCVHELTRGS